MREHVRPSPTESRVAAARIAGRTPALPSAIGNRALARLVLAREEKDKPAPVGTDEGWSAAGPWGDKVRGLLEDHLTTKDLGSLLDQLPDLAGSAAGAAGGIDAVRLDKEELTKLAAGVGKWGTGAAEKWLASPNGKKFLDAVRTKLGNNPKTVYWTLVSIVAAGLGTAVGLYAAGVIDPPMLAKDIPIGKDWTIKPGLDLGKPQEQWFQSAKLGAGWQATPLLHMDLDTSFAFTKATEKAPDTYTLGGTYGLKLLDADDKKRTLVGGSLGGEYRWGPNAYKLTGAVDASLVKDYLQVTAKAVIDSEKGSSVSAGASGKAGGFDYKAAATWDLTKEQLSALTAHLGYTSEDQTLSWLVDLAHGMKGDEQTESGKAQLTAVVKDYVLRVEARLAYSSKDGWSGGSTASLAIPIGSTGIFAAPMLGLGYGAWDKDTGAKGSAWLQAGAGVGYKDLPVSLYGAWNQPIGSDLPGFASIGVGIPLGKPEKKKANR